MGYFGKPLKSPQPAHLFSWNFKIYKYTFLLAAIFSSSKNRSADLHAADPDAPSEDLAVA